MRQRRGKLGALLALFALPLVRLTAQESDSSRRVQWITLGARGTFGYERPGVLQSVRNWPGTFARSARKAVRPEQLDEWAWVAASTTVTIAADEWLLRQTRAIAKQVGLPRNHPSYDLRFAGMKVPIPTTIGSGLYWLGDGMASLAVAAGFLVRGYARDDHRAFRTASQITESLLAAGTFTQLIKHATGRQTPSEATVPGGRWNWFPSLGEYNANIPGHDAFPSGHLAVAVATVEVIARNYPEKRVVRPLGYTLLTLCSFAMVNNGVHWASDYPLAIMLGKGVASVAVRRGRVERSDSQRTGERGVSPFFAPGVVGLRLAFP